MRTLQTSLEELLKDPKVMRLKPHTLKVYLYLIQKSQGQTITKFSVRKQANEWGENPDLKLSDNKNTVSLALKELVEADLIKVDFDSKTLEIL